MTLFKLLDMIQALRDAGFTEEDVGELLKGIKNIEIIAN